MSTNLHQYYKALFSLKLNVWNLKPFNVIFLKPADVSTNTRFSENTSSFQVNLHILAYNFFIKIKPDRCWEAGCRWSLYFFLYYWVIFTACFDLKYYFYRSLMNSMRSEMPDDILADCFSSIILMTIVVEASHLWTYLHSWPVATSACIRNK